MSTRPSSKVRLAGVALALDLVGARLACSRGLIAEPLGLAAPSAIPRSVVLAGWGTALSGPWLVDGGLGALAVAADNGRADAGRAVRYLGWLRLAGVLAEPVTWGRRRPRWAVLVSAGQLALAAALIRSSSGGDGESDGYGETATPSESAPSVLGAPFS